MLTNLKKLRESAGISQRQLAEYIGTSQQSINKYENHNIEPDIATLIELANYFNTSVDYLIGNADREIQYTPVLNDKECVLIQRYRKLNKTQQKCIEIVIDTFIEKKKELRLEVPSFMYKHYIIIFIDQVLC